MTQTSSNLNSFPGKEKIGSYFEDLLSKHGDNHLSLDWNSKQSQELRYAVFLEIIGYTEKTKDFSMLDVGCGIGHFYDYLKDHGLIKEFNIKYEGLDISEKLIDFARKKNPGVEFHSADLLEDRFNKKYDFVMASGPFNIRMTDIESHKQSVFRTISRMFNMANAAVAVNFICRDVLYMAKDDIGGRYVYYTPEEIIQACRSLTNKYILRHDYHPGDFTVYLFK
jgi:SAM-dependent methyltransferase